MNSSSLCVCTALTTWIELLFLVSVPAWSGGVWMLFMLFWFYYIFIGRPSLEDNASYFRVIMSLSKWKSSVVSKWKISQLLISSSNMACKLLYHILPFWPYRLIKCDSSQTPSNALWNFWACSFGWCWYFVIFSAHPPFFNIIHISWAVDVVGKNHFNQSNGGELTLYNCIQIRYKSLVIVFNVKFRHYNLSVGI